MSQAPVMPPGVVLNECLPAESSGRSFHLALAVGSFDAVAARRIRHDLALR